MNNFDLEEKVTLAGKNFVSGYNCAQSVFLAYYDVVGLELEVAQKMSVSFGGGMGRLREVCGAMSACAMLAGFKYPVEDKDDKDARTRNYAMVQKIAEEFKAKHNTIICRDLLPKAEAESTDPTPSDRTPDYYAARPCSRYVMDAARIAGRMLKGELED